LKREIERERERERERKECVGCGVGRKPLRGRRLRVCAFLLNSSPRYATRKSRKVL
jgi:hypothetical protein